MIISAHSGSTRRLPRHRNPGLEIVLLERGVLQWQVEGVVETVQPGQVFFTLPWQEHGSVLAFEPGHLWHFFILRLENCALEQPGPFNFPRQLRLSARETRQIATPLRRTARHTWDATPLLSQAIRHFVTGHKQGNDPGSPRQRSLITLVLAELAKAVEGGQSAAQSYARHRIRRVTQALQEDFCRPWTLPEMAAQAGLRKSQFLKEFHRETGDTPRVYLNRIRIENARRDLLAQPEQSVTQIAIANGFSSSQYFATVFRQFTGRPPTVYRAKLDGD